MVRKPSNHVSQSIGALLTQRVSVGDMILLKRSGGPIVAVCRVTSAWFYEMEADTWQHIRQTFGKALRADNASFWDERKSALYATLMTIDALQVVQPIPCAKRDRRGWVVLHESDASSLFSEACYTQ